MIVCYPSRHGGFVIRAVDKDGRTLRMQRSINREEDWPIAASLAQETGFVEVVILPDPPAH